MSYLFNSPMDPLTDNNVMMRSDHDTLIRLESKVDNLILITQDTNTKATALDIRVTSLEKISDEMSSTELLKKIEVDHQWIHDYRLTWKFILGVCIVVSTIIGFVISKVAEIISTISMTK